jgi:hypothetical protein
MRNELAKIRGLATEIVLIADDFGAEFPVKEVAEMAEEIMETSRRLIQDVVQAETAEAMVDHLGAVV